jgi:hypothetical protein
MRRMTSRTFLLFALGGIVLGLALVVASRVTLLSFYSLRRIPADQASSKTLATWGELEEAFRRRDTPLPRRLDARDPLWPNHVKHPGRSAEAVVERAVGRREAGGASRSQAEAPRPAPQSGSAGAAPPALPQLVALLLDREARAVLQHDGRSAVVRVGDRIGPFRVLRVAADGVVVESAAGHEQLRMR